MTYKHNLKEKKTIKVAEKNVLGCTTRLLGQVQARILLFHRFCIQNGPLGLFSLKFCITEVVNVARHFPDQLQPSNISPEEDKKGDNENMFLLVYCFEEIDSAI